MKYTSSEAAKLLRKLNEEQASLLDLEERSREFNAALGEDVESVRPAYDYGSVQRQLAELEEKIRIVKHAVNCFNTTQMVPGFDMTIDQMLVYLPQLTARKAKLTAMCQRLPKQRENGRAFSGQPALIDYSYANYDIEAVRLDCQQVADELARAQTALDLVNNTAVMEIEL